MRSPPSRTLSCFAAAALLAVPAAAQNTTRVSVDSAGQQAGGDSEGPSASASGRYVAFDSDATNLVPLDTNGVTDVFVHDRQTGLTARVSVSSGGAQGNDESRKPRISPDGRYVAFESYATNLVAGDTNAVADVFVHDRQTGQTRRVSVGAGGAQANGPSYAAAISGGGLFIAFESSATNLVAGDTNAQRDVFVHDRLAGATARVSVDSAGAQALGSSWHPTLSADGRFVAFHSSSVNLVPGDTNGAWDVFVHDRQTGQTGRVSVATGGAQANGYSDAAAISGDGAWIAFVSDADNLVAGDTNGFDDVFLHDRVAGRTYRVSVDSAGVQGDRHSYAPALSSDGRFVLFASNSTNLVAGDANGFADVFLRDHFVGVTERVSVDSLGAEGDADSGGLAHALSADGRFAFFPSAATNLVASDTNASLDVFARDRGAPPPTLSYSGTCPGTATLTIENATPGRMVAIVYGLAGTYVKPGNPCAGISLGIATVRLAGTVTADPAGRSTWSSQVPGALCGLTFQAVDVATCRPTNTILL